MIEPNPNESESEFSERCHAAIGDSMTTDERTQTCFLAWKKSGKPSVSDQYAQQLFGSDKFRHVANVPVFAEHSTTDAEGKVTVYDHDALEVICQRCNERIEDTNDFSPITEGHTPDKEQLAQGAKMPRVLGYAGPFRMGMIGNKKPRWAIFADEWHHAEDADEMKRLCRRSPEVWIEERMEDRFMDPIAALGAETPRLDMGMVRMCRSADGRMIQKYSAVAPAAMTVFVPTDEIDRKKHSAGEEIPDGAAVATEQERHMSPEEIKQVVDAIMETEQMQWVASQMNAGPETVEGGDTLGADPLGGDPLGAPDIPEAPAPAEVEMGQEDQEMFSRYMCGDVDEDEFKQYAAGRRKQYAAGDGGLNPPDGDVADEELAKFGKRLGKNAPASIQFSRLSTEVRRYRDDARKEKAHRQALENRLATIETEKRRTERYSMLQQLEREGYSFDLDIEYDRCKDVPNDQWMRHLDIIQENYSRIPRADVVPSLFVDQRDETQGNEKYQKKLNEKVLAIQAKYQREGKQVCYDDCRAEAEQEIQLASAS